MPLPVLTPEQREAALAKSAEARAVLSGALDRIRDGAVVPALAVADADSPVQKARVRTFLLAVPGVGAVTADKILADLGVGAKRRLSALGDRQRETLAGFLADRVSR